MKMKMNKIKNKGNFLKEERKQIKVPKKNNTHKVLNF